MRSSAMYLGLMVKGLSVDMATLDALGRTYLVVGSADEAQKEPRYYLWTGGLAPGGAT